MQKTALPQPLKRGSPARLIPVLADTSKENRATSVFLSCLMAVDNFGSRLLGTVGQSAGTRAKIRCFTEVVLEKSPEKQDRPDGLIILEVGKRRWTALIESKIGAAELDAEQLERYLALAKLNKIDAVITISNQFAALPTHHPVQLSKKKLRSVKIYHWSWVHILTQATLILDTEDVLDKDQRYILKEMTRYFGHESSGVRHFKSMNKEWGDACQKAKSGERLTKSSLESLNTVGAWHQKQRDICLLLTGELATPVSLRLSHVHKQNPERRLQEDCQKLAKSALLEFSLDIPDAASPLSIAADLARRTVTCSMRVNAPEDKKSAKARVNWLIRQLADSNPTDIKVKALYRGGPANMSKPLEEVRENPGVLFKVGSRMVPSSFVVMSMTDLAGKFSARRKFVEELDTIIPTFYKEVGENLRNWVPPPPKIKEDQKVAGPKPTKS